MLAIASVIVVILLSLIITRVATVILTLTGLSRESARFQARSAFSGVGFTTREAETVVAHPVRRRVVMTLMLLGSAGLVAVVSSLVISFSRAGGEARLTRLGVLLAGLLGVWLIARSPVLDRAFARLVRALLRRYTTVDARDYAGLLELADGWSVAELFVTDASWMAGRRLGDLALRDEGAAVLGIHRPDGSYVGVPVGDTVVLPGDRVLLYARRELIGEIDSRPPGEAGDRAHEEALRRQRAAFADQTVREVRAGRA
jgi:hypothetical protein